MYLFNMTRWDIVQCIRNWKVMCQRSELRHYDPSMVMMVVPGSDHEYSMPSKSSLYFDTTHKLNKKGEVELMAHGCKYVYLLANCAAYLLQCHMITSAFLRPVSLYTWFISFCYRSLNGGNSDLLFPQCVSLHSLTTEPPWLFTKVYWSYPYNPPLISPTPWQTYSNHKPIDVATAIGLWLIIINGAYRLALL